MIPAFRKIRSAIEDLQSVQEAVDVIFNDIRNKQIIDGRLIEDIYIATGSVKAVDHGLGKDPRGWIVVKKNANADIYQSTSDAPKATLNLNATANVTISLWVF